MIKVNFTHAYVSQDRLINDIFTIHKIYSFMPSLVKTDLVVLEKILKSWLLIMYILTSLLSFPLQKVSFLYLNFFFNSLHKSIMLCVKFGCLQWFCRRRWKYWKAYDNSRDTYVMTYNRQHLIRKDYLRLSVQVSKNSFFGKQSCMQPQHSSLEQTWTDAYKRYCHNWSPQKVQAAPKTGASPGAMIQTCCWISFLQFLCSVQRLLCIYL